jgi:sugar-specific transcriptional regulator TrmB
VSTHTELVARLQDIGMSGYEAKAYLALISSDRPMNGYEVAKRSGVPRSTVYETLGKLAARGAAFEVNSGSDTTTYLALPSDALLRRVRDRVDQSLAGLALELDAVVQPPRAPTSHHVQGASDVIERAIDLITTARRTVTVLGEPDQLASLDAALLAAQARGVTVSVLQPDDRIESGQACHVLVVVKDTSQVLIAGANDDSVWAHYSDDPAVVDVAFGYIRQDLMIRALFDHVGADAARDVLAGMPDLQLFDRRVTPIRTPATLRPVAGSRRADG